MQPLKIVHIVEDCRGGVGTIVGLLIDSHQNDSEVAETHLIYDPACVDSPLLSAPATRHSYKGSRNPLRIPAVARQIAAIVKAIDPDVIVAHSSFPGVFTRVVAGDYPIVYCAHGWAFQQDVAGWRRALYILAERWLARRTAAIIEISADEARASRQAGIVAPRFVIPHGLPDIVPVDVPLAIDAQSINLAFVGRNAPQKGLDILAQAFGDARLQATKLWVVGVKPGEMPEFEAQPNVTMLGWRSRGEIHAIMSHVDAIVVPSRWEGFGLVILEAMRAGKGAIASTVGAIPELIQDNVNGRLFDIHDQESLIEAMASCDKQAMGRWGAEAADIFRNRYRWQDCYGKWKAVLQQVADGGPLDRSGAAQTAYT